MSYKQENNLNALLNLKNRELANQEAAITVLKQRIAELEKVAEKGVKLHLYHTAFADNNEMVFYSVAARDAFDEHTETLRAAGYDITKEHIL